MKRTTAKKHPARKPLKVQIKKAGAEKKVAPSMSKFHCIGNDCDRMG